MERRRVERVSWLGARGEGKVVWAAWGEEGVDARLGGAVGMVRLLLLLLLCLWLWLWLWLGCGFLVGVG